MRYDLFEQRQLIANSIYIKDLPVKYRPFAEPKKVSLSYPDFDVKFNYI